VVQRPGSPSCAASGDFPLKMNINDKDKFHGSHAIPGTSYSAAIHGRFIHDRKKAVGTIRLSGSFAGG
jgi:hypothetical protein